MSNQESLSDGEKRILALITLIWLSGPAGAMINLAYIGIGLLVTIMLLLIVAALSGGVWQSLTLNLATELIEALVIFLVFDIYVRKQLRQLESSLNAPNWRFVERVLRATCDDSRTAIPPTDGQADGEETPEA